MKGNRIKYEKIERIPFRAKAVKVYAEDNSISIAAVYKRFKKGKIKIFDYQGFNIVVENS